MKFPSFTISHFCTAEPAHSCRIRPGISGKLLFKTSFQLRILGSRSRDPPTILSTWSNNTA